MALRAGALRFKAAFGPSRQFRTTSQALGFGSHSSDNDPKVLEEEKRKQQKGGPQRQQPLHEMQLWVPGRSPGSPLDTAPPVGTCFVQTYLEANLWVPAGESVSTVKDGGNWNEKLASDSEAAVSISIQCLQCTFFCREISDWLSEDLRMLSRSRPRSITRVTASRTCNNTQWRPQRKCTRLRMLRESELSSHP